MTEKWDTLTKKELIQLLESYDDEKHIVFKVNLKQGTVGFWDVKKDEINSDTDKLVLMSPALDKWYTEDIQELVEENNELKKESYGNLDGLETYKALYSDLSEKFSNLEADYDDLKKENEQLQSELLRYKELNKLDVLKASYSTEDVLITKLQSKCDKKQEHIVVLENKIRRMREAIHKLEWLASHRNGELIRENEQLKSFIKGKCIWCGAYLEPQYRDKFGDD